MKHKPSISNKVMRTLMIQFMTALDISFVLVLIDHAFYDLPEKAFKATGRLSVLEH